VAPEDEARISGNSGLPKEGVLGQGMTMEERLYYEGNYIIFPQSSYLLYRNVASGQVELYGEVRDAEVDTDISADDEIYIHDKIYAGDRNSRLPSS
jgi:hypothetical protein